MGNMKKINRIVMAQVRRNTLVGSIKNMRLLRTRTDIRLCIATPNSVNTKESIKRRIVQARELNQLAKGCKEAKTMNEFGQRLRVERRKSNVSISLLRS
ncbi:hypothetical protein [Enterocloster sp.]|uniref:hypothetical protein n=1 Tax=Enterocloster sp. TaxID=2719315 RepID=UPI0039A1433A